MRESDRVALVSMPWMGLQLPSIQLAVLSGCLATRNIPVDVHELYVDYASWLTPELYDQLSNMDGRNAEWIFSCCYFGPEQGNWLLDFLPLRAPMHLNKPEVEEELLRALVPATDRFLDAMIEATDWGGYDIIGFTLTINQIAASMAMARRIKLRWPGVKIVFGGNACAGPSGAAIVKACAYVDVAVSVEGEDVFPRLIEAFRTNSSPESIPGIAYRSGGAVVRTAQGPLINMRQPRPPANFDSYFARLERLGLAEGAMTWLPFESSRGCWWGELMQCSFCGLHEIMTFRSREPEDVLAELDDLHARYGISRFFCVDLIVPKEYYETLFKRLAESGRDYTIFYEIKANLTREKMETLRRAGVRWVQPGIESLDGDILKLMRKGVHPLQNVQLLKWSRELGIRLTWNIITGTPGEKPQAYETMVANIGKLRHLQPPTTLTEFELHRFSPYFDHAEDFGIVKMGPLAGYREIFPVAEAHRNDIIYRYDYEVVSDRAVPVAEYTAALRKALDEWRSAFAGGALLVQVSRPDGTCLVIRRDGRGQRDFALDERETTLYDHLDQYRTEADIARRLGESRRDLFGTADTAQWVSARLDAWDRDELVIRSGKQIVALAVRYRSDLDQDWTADIAGAAPVPYLGRPLEIAA